MAIFVAKGHSQDPQTTGGAFIRQVRLLRRIRYKYKLKLLSFEQLPLVAVISGRDLNLNLPFLFTDFACHDLRPQKKNLDLRGRSKILFGGRRSWWAKSVKNCLTFNPYGSNKPGQIANLKMANLS